MSFITNSINPVHKRFYPYLREYVPLVALSIIFSIVVSAAGALFPWSLKYAVDKLFIAKEFSLLMPIIFSLTAIMLVYSLFLFLNSYFMQKVKLSLEVHLRTKLISGIFRKKLDYFRDSHTGKITSLMNNDLTLAQFIPELIARLYFELPIRMIAVLITMFYMNYRLTLLVLVAIPPIYLMVLATRKIRRKLSVKRMESVGTLFKDFQEFLSGIRVIKAWNLDSYTGKKFKKGHDRYLTLALKEVKFQSLLKGGISISGVIIINIVLYFAVVQIQTEGVTPGDYAGFMLALWLFIEPLKMRGYGYSNLINSTVAAERILDVLEDTSQDEANLGSGVEVDEISGITFSKASFAFDGSSILDDINIDFKPSTVYAISGPNGSGKTTLVESLVGFTRPSQGELLVNGTSIENVNLTQLRNRSSFVMQDLALFNIPIKENIVFDDTGSKDKYLKALKTAKVDAFISDDERDDTTVISERGGNFSGGEKQRLAIARALYKDHDLLILDESNSNISEDVFMEILKDIIKEKDGKIIVFISHNPDYWNLSDIIYEVNDGRVTQKARC